MQKTDLADMNPLRIFAKDGDGNPVNKRLALVMSRAGLGKTAILVQIALDSILRGNQVLHVSVGQSLDKTRAWYDDILRDIANEVKLEDTNDLNDEIMRNCLIMTFKESDFSRPKLEERVNDLVYQNIFRPSCIVVDGFDFAGTDRQAVEDVKEMVEAMGMQMWFSATCHREDDRKSEEGVPAPCHEVGDLLDTVVIIQPESDKANLALNVIKDETGRIKHGKTFDLDPSTYLVKKA